MLIAINALIAVAAGCLGYVLAGITLRPIVDMIAEQNRFISDASHELKTPLTSLKSAFEVYLRSHRPTIHEAKTIISESISDVDRLQMLSESLLQLIQYEKPTNHLLMNTVSIRSVIASAIRNIQPLARKRHISIEYNPKDYSVTGNAHGLRYLVVILLDNAIKYSAQKQSISVTVKPEEDKIAISVTDHGIGIAPKDIPHIFDRFYRADSARSRQLAGGFGLGLSIAQKIVHTHKGTIGVISVVNKGTTFTVRLPVSFR